MKEYIVLKSFILDRERIEPAEEGTPAVKVKLKDHQAKRLIKTNHIK